MYPAWVRAGAATPVKHLRFPAHGTPGGRRLTRPFESITD